MSDGPFQVLYTCEPCGILDRKVTVRHRAIGEDILKWMDHVARRVGEDHSAHSPYCTARTMTNLKIPVPDGTKAIGAPVE